MISDDRETYLDKITTQTAIETFDYVQTQTEQWIGSVAMERIQMTQRERDNVPMYSYTFVANGLDAHNAASVGEYFNYWRQALPFNPDLDIVHRVGEGQLHIKLIWHFSGGNRPEEDPHSTQPVATPVGVRVTAVGGSNGRRRYRKQERPKHE